jgi:biotin transport system substrate-specific component
MNILTKVIKLDRSTVLKETAVIFAGFVTLAFLARISLPLPFTPIFITGSTLGVYLIGAVLGARRGAIAVTVYLIAGGLGLPIFSGARFGFTFLAGITGGYILGYVFSAAFIGYFFDKGLNSFFKRVIVLAGGSAVIFAFGLIWLSFYVPAEKVLLYGLYPFIPGEVFKICFAASLVKPARKFIGKI